MRTALLLAHLGLAAGWLGAMGYSLFVVQPRAERFFRTRSTDDDYEQFLTTLAAGNRWSVLGIIAGLAASGLGLLLIGPTNLPVQLAKAALLVIAVLVFWNVSWRIWPRRVFALPDEVPALRSAVRRSGLLLTALATAAFVLGVLGSSH